MTTPATPPSASDEAAPLNSIGELRSQHYNLLEKSGGVATDAGVRSSILSFLEAAAALGSKLAQPSERIEAQRTLDYWASAVTGSGSEIMRQAILDPLLVTGEKEAATAAAEYVRTLSAEDQRIARWIVLRLLQLEPDGVSVTLPIRSPLLITAGLPPTRSEEILARFKGFGLVVPAAEGLRLCGTSVLNEWAEARQWWAQRRRLRGAAKFWEAHQFDDGALLESEDLIEEAGGYLDRTDLEQKFVEASNARRAKVSVRQRRVIGVLAILCVLLAVAVIWALRQEKAARDETARASRAVERRDAAMDQLSQDSATARAKLLKLVDESNKERDSQVESHRADIAKLREEVGVLKMSVEKKQGIAEAALAIEKTIEELDTSEKQNTQRAIDNSRNADSLAGRLVLPTYKILGDQILPVSDVHFTSANPPEVVAGTSGDQKQGATYLWKLDGSAVTPPLPGDAARTRISPDSKWLVALPWSNSFRAYSRADNWKATKLGSGPATYTVGAFSPDGTIFATGANDRIQLWDWAQGVPANAAWSEPAPPSQPEILTSLVYSKDRRRFAVSSSNNNFRIYQLHDPVHPEAGADLWRNEKLSGPVREVAFSTDGSWILARAGSDVWVYPTSAPGAAGVRLPHEAPVVSASFSPDTSWIASLTADGKLYLSSSDAGSDWKVVLSTPAHQPTTTGALHWSWKGKYLATGGEDGKILIWDTTAFGAGVTLQPAMSLLGHAAKVTAIEFSKDDRYLASGGGTSVRLWDFENIRTWQQGRFKSFNTSNTTKNEELAVVRSWKEANDTRVFLPNQEGTSVPFTRQLDPMACYIAARWNYKATSRAWLLANKVPVMNLQTGAVVDAQAVDWGPGESTGFAMHLSPGLIKALGLKPDDEAAYFVPGN